MFDSLLFRLLDPVVDAVLSELPDEAASVGRRVWSMDVVRCATVAVTGVLLAEAARRVDSGLGNFVDDARGLPRGGGRFDDPCFLA